jgi:tetratricopeptide (TPR) repeat protein
MSTSKEAFALALRYHNAGNFFQAEQLYRQILQADRACADAWCFLGAACDAQGKSAEARTHYARAIELKPDYAAAHYNLGLALEHEGQLAEAAASYRRALQLQPDNPATLNNLGNALKTLGNLENAIACYRQALNLAPDFVECRVNLGNALAAQDNLVDAVPLWQEALRQRPDLAEVKTNLAFASVQQGNALFRQGKKVEAESHYREALQLDPQYADAYYNLGNLALGEEKLEEASRCYRQALRIDTNSAEAWNNLGTVHQRKGEIDQALAAYERALQLQADYPQAQLNRAMMRLLLGDFQNGWADYESRLAQPGTVEYFIPRPRWDGTALQGRTILLRGEQGLGDTMQFIRYAPLVKERGGKVIVQCDSCLMRLLAGAPGIDCLRGWEEPVPMFDVYVPLPSLPGIFATSQSTIPKGVPYLRADTKLVEHWQRELESLNGFKVGIAWQGSPAYGDDRWRSVPLARFAPLSAVEGVRLISLQKGSGIEQLQAWSGQNPPVTLAENLDESSGAFMDTAAIMKSLDLVICSDSAVAHLAGALGVAVWVALPLAPDWRWLLNREDSPWYPTMRLFRQTRCGDWASVFERMSGELRSLIKRPQPQPPISLA